MADDLTRLMEQVYRLDAQLAEARQQRDGLAVLVERIAERVVHLTQYDHANHQNVGGWRSWDRCVHPRCSLSFQVLGMPTPLDDRARQIGAAVDSVLGFAIGHRIGNDDAIADSTCFECQAHWLAGARERHEDGCQVGLLREARGAGGGS